MAGPGFHPTKTIIFIVGGSLEYIASRWREAGIWSLQCICLYLNQLSKVIFSLHFTRAQRILINHVMHKHGENQLFSFLAEFLNRKKYNA